MQHIKRSIRLFSSNNGKVTSFNTNVNPTASANKYRYVRSSPVLIEPVYPILYTQPVPATHQLPATSENNNNASISSKTNTDSNSNIENQQVTIRRFSSQWIALQKRRFYGNVKSSYAESIFMRRLGGARIDRKQLEADALDMFKSLNAAMLGGVSDVLGDMVTETLKPYIENYMVAGEGRRVTQNDKVQEHSNMRIIGVDQPPQLMQLRVHHLAEAANVGFIQATIRITTEQIPVPIKKTSSSQRGKETTKGLPSNQSKPHTWRYAIAPSGDIYYYDRKTLQTTYKKPFFFGIESFWFPVADWTFGETGVILPKQGSYSSDSSASSNSTKTKVVQNYVMLERPLHIPSTKWRIHHF